MQLAGRTCGACDAQLEVLGDGDGCSACDVALCNACLDGSARCPSCQRPFDETRSASPPAGSSKGARQLRAVSVTLLGSIVLMQFLSSNVPFFTMITQLMVVGLLLMWTARGGTWSRWLLVVLVALGAVGHTLACIEGQGAGRVISLGVAVLYVACAWTLGFSKAIAAHMRSQRQS